MTPTWIEHWDVVGGLITGLLALLWWFETRDRHQRDRDVGSIKKSFAEGSAHLGAKVDRLSEELRAQHEEMHRAILDHERRISTLEGERRVVEAGQWPR